MRIVRIVEIVDLGGLEKLAVSVGLEQSAAGRSAHLLPISRIGLRSFRRIGTGCGQGATLWSDRDNLKI